MINLQDFWNENSARISDDKGRSQYAVDKEVDFPKNARVCDLGGGTGADAIYFAQKGHDVVIADIADEPLAKAGLRAVKFGVASKVQATQCDFGSGVLPFGDAAFDIVYSRLALHYFESKTLAKLFSEIYRILRPGGRAYLSLKSPDDVAEMDFLATNAVEKEAGVFIEDSRIKTRYTTERLNVILADAGIPHDSYNVAVWIEKFGSSNDVIKSGKDELIVNEVTIFK